MIIAEFTNRMRMNVKIIKLNSTTGIINSGKYNITIDGRVTQKSLSADEVIGWLANASHCEVD
ncbi:MAG: hypothetical protein EB127_31275 [Alphaproteobacteria bacterium]|nr:hypothetical protein [Alphaproteobacteria bacterium]